MIKFTPFHLLSLSFWMYLTMKRAILFIALSLAVSLALRHSAGAASPSFSCAKADSESEKTICASPHLSKQDRDLSHAYHAILARLDPATAAAFEEDERTFIEGARDRVFPDPKTRKLDSGIEDKVNRRLNFLSRVLPEPPEGLIGHWEGVLGYIDIAPGENGELEVTFEVSEPANGVWVCELDGQGRAENGVIVMTEEDKSTITLSRAGQVLQVVSTESASGGHSYCGRNGSVDGTFFAAKPDPKLAGAQPLK